MDGGGGEEEDNGAGAAGVGGCGWVGTAVPPVYFWCVGERRAMCTSASLFASALRRSVSVHQKKNSTQFYVHSNSSCFNFGPKV